MMTIAEYKEQTKEMIDNLQNELWVENIFWFVKTMFDKEVIADDDLC